MNKLGVNVQLDEYSVTLLIASLENDIARVKAGYLIKFQISHFYIYKHTFFSLPMLGSGDVTHYHFMV